MENVWLSIPLCDYEAHMALPNVAQSACLACELRALLSQYRPASIALLGCAGGNGLETVDPAVTTRVVAVDINPNFVAATRERFPGRFQRFEPIVCDISADQPPPFESVDLVFAGLLLEYVPLPSAFAFFRAALVKHGVLAVVIQRASERLPAVSSSPYVSLQVVAPHMHLVEPDAVTGHAASFGLALSLTRHATMPNGKILTTQVYRVQ
jgi:hypothetical protein